MKTWQCLVCGWIYEEAEGWPDEGIAPRHPLGGDPRRLVLPRLRSRQGGLRNDRDHPCLSRVSEGPTPGELPRRAGPATA